MKPDLHGSRIPAGYLPRCHGAIDPRAGFAISPGEPAGGPMADPAPAAFISVIERVSGSLPGYRRAHARGLGLRGVFRASDAARALSTAEHFQGADIPCIVRFSNASGNPCTPDRLSPKEG